MAQERNQRKTGVLILEAEVPHLFQSVCSEISGAISQCTGQEHTIDFPRAPVTWTQQHLGALCVCLGCNLIPTPVGYFVSLFRVL